MKKFALKFLWGSHSLAIALDQIIDEERIAVTPYFVWPVIDAWESMRLFLDSTNWISESDSIFFINRITEVINLWTERNSIEDSDKKEIEQRFNTLFPEITFVS